MRLVLRVLFCVVFPIPALAYYIFARPKDKRDLSQLQYL